MLDFKSPQCVAHGHAAAGAEGLGGGAQRNGLTGNEMPA
jgi:hypothetical protein